ncbi:glr1804 [Gloeobacter violaceus PCC 7421]|uniref:Glr1804 protein n=1 Tax=Gloeobacter violaceus (strain ATCC 29082 / PCC 7421) TaxID=251221 RepID=Q7NJM8_GLOVI|nr:glr1804 [Gloeobacter violaceus PCC 7421]
MPLGSVEILNTFLMALQLFLLGEDLTLLGEHLVLLGEHLVLLGKHLLLHVLHDRQDLAEDVGHLLNDRAGSSQMLQRLGKLLVEHHLTGAQFGKEVELVAELLDQSFQNTLDTLDSIGRLAVGVHGLPGLEVHGDTLFNHC